MSNKTTEATSGTEALWDRVQTTDPGFTKNFSRSGGFSGTAINATYLARKATEVFGPIGLGWGVEILEENYREGGPLGFDRDGNSLGREVIHVLRVELWYELNGKRGSVKQFGQTTFVGKNKNGCFTDEEAPKKSLTDGMTKCLSLLGFGSDVHLGMYDDNKYVSALKEEFSDDHQQGQQGQQRQQQRQQGQERQQQGQQGQERQQQGQQSQQGQERQQQGQQQGQNEGEQPQLSARYLKYKERLKEGVTDKKIARQTIHEDTGLSELEKALLLSTPELKLAEQESGEQPAAQNSHPGDTFL